MKLTSSKKNNVLSSLLQFFIISSGRDGRDGRKGSVGARGMPGPKGIHYDLLIEELEKISHVLTELKETEVEEWENEKCFGNTSGGDSLHWRYEILHKISRVFL